jgi:hypothetical protein
MLNDRISELKATRDQAHLAAERGSGRDSNAPGRVSHLRRVQAHRHHSGGYRRDHLHGLTMPIFASSGRGSTRERLTCGF